MKPNDPVFPTSEKAGDVSVTFGGMTMREYMATQIVAARTEGVYNGEQMEREVTASIATANELIRQLNAAQRADDAAAIKKIHKSD